MTQERRSLSIRRRSQLVLTGVGAFVIFLFTSALVYPGGTWWNQEHQGFHLVQNFWCDLLRPVTHGGHENERGAGLARIALLSLAITLVPFWGLIEARYSLSKNAGRWLRIFGWLGCLGLAIVALATGQTEPQVHTWAILLLGPCGLIALVAGVGLGFRQGTTGVKAVGALTILLSVLNMVQYAREEVGGAPDWIGLAVIQKLATLSLLSWIAVVAWCAKGADQESGP